MRAQKDMQVEFRQRVVEQEAEVVMELVVELVVVRMAVEEVLVLLA